MKREDLKNKIKEAKNYSGDRLEALTDYLDRYSDADVNRYLKNGIHAWTIEDYKDSLRECGTDEEEIEEAIDRSDMINGFIIEKIL